MATTVTNSQPPSRREPKSGCSRLHPYYTPTVIFKQSIQWNGVDRSGSMSNTTSSIAHHQTYLPPHSDSETGCPTPPSTFISSPSSQSSRSIDSDSFSTTSNSSSISSLSSVSGAPNATQDVKTAAAQDNVIKKEGKEKFVGMMVDQTVALLLVGWFGSSASPSENVIPSTTLTSNTLLTMSLSQCSTTLGISNRAGTAQPSTRTQQSSLFSGDTPSQAGPHGPALPVIGNASDNGSTPSPGVNCSSMQSNMPLRQFILEIMRRSRTTCATLQGAICYLEALKVKLPEIRQAEKRRVMALLNDSDGGHSQHSVSGPLALQSSGGDVAMSSGLSSSSNCDHGARFSDDPQNGPLDVATDTLAALTMPKASSPSPLLCPRRSFLAAVILASKFLQDRAYSNKAWSKLSGLPAREITRCERAFGDALDWRLWIGKGQDCSDRPVTRSATVPNLSVSSAPAVPLSRVPRRCKSDGELKATARQRLAKMAWSTPSPIASSPFAMPIRPASCIVPTSADAFWPTRQAVVAQPSLPPIHSLVPALLSQSTNPESASWIATPELTSESGSEHSLPINSPLPSLAHHMFVSNSSYSPPGSEYGSQASGYATTPSLLSDSGYVSSGSSSSGDSPEILKSTYARRISIPELLSTSKLEAQDHSVHVSAPDKLSFDFCPPGLVPNGPVVVPGASYDQDRGINPTWMSFGRQEIPSATERKYTSVFGGPDAIMARTTQL